MRTLRLSLAMVITAVLLASVTSSALAQADEDETAGPFSANIVDFLEVDDMVWAPGPPHGRLDDWKMVVAVEATDPRLGGTWTMVQSGHGFGEPGTQEAFSVYSGTARIKNADGEWIGEVVNFASDPYEHMRLVVEGLDGHEGLTAIIDQSGEFGEFQGIVFEYGLPPTTQPPAQ